MSEPVRSPDVVSTETSANRTWAILLTLGAGLLRFFPHPWNLTPVGASGLFGGARLPLLLALVLVLTMRVVSDTILQMFSPTEQGYAFLLSPMMGVVYLSTAFNVFLGRWLCQKATPLRIGSAALAGSLQFFLVTNFYAWVSSAFLSTRAPALYAPTFQGLIDCYVAALPFFHSGTLAGDLLYSGVLFGAYALLTKTAPVPETLARREA